VLINRRNISGPAKNAEAYLKPTENTSLAYFCTLLATF